MTLQQLKGRYAGLSHEIDSLAAASLPDRARLLGLMNELDQVHRQLTDLRRRTLHAPTLREVVEGCPGAAAPAVAPPPKEQALAV